MNPQLVESARLKMIQQQIRPWQVEDSTVLEALEQVRREDFVPAAYRNQAFADLALPLPAGQSMLPPRVAARLLQDAAVRPGDKVLLIGAGSGYLAALLAFRAQRVVALEIEPELARLARANLQHAGVLNVDLRQMDGVHGSAADGPFDVIVLAGSALEAPTELLQQLKPGGRLVGLFGQEPIMHAQTITRTGTDTYTSVERWDDVAPPLRGFAQAPSFTF